MTGLRTEDAIRDISRQDARWVYDLIGPIADEQIAAALRASGADETAIVEFTRSIRARLNRLKELSN